MLAAKYFTNDFKYVYLLTIFLSLNVLYIFNVSIFKIKKKLKRLAGKSVEPIIRHVRNLNPQLLAPETCAFCCSFMDVGLPHIIYII